MPGSGDRGRRTEWLLGLVSALLVLAMAGYLVREGLVNSDTFPELAVVAAPLPAGAASPQLRFVVTNRGGRTARAVALALTLRDGDGRVERRRLTIDYVPAHSEVTGGFVLPPGGADLEADLVVEGYLDP